MRKNPLNKGIIMENAAGIGTVTFCTDAANRVSGACLDAVAGESAKWSG